MTASQAIEPQAMEPEVIEPEAIEKVSIVVSKGSLEGIYPR